MNEAQVKTILSMINRPVALLSMDQLEAINALTQAPKQEPKPESYQVRVRYDSLVSGGNMVGAIKAMRDVTGFGLKEAKDIVDAAQESDNGVLIQSVTLDGVRTLRFLPEMMELDIAKLRQYFVVSIEQYK